MQNSPVWKMLRFCGMIALGSATFALGFDLFLEPNAVNVGGMTGLAMVIRKVIGMGSVGLISALLNVPLFLLGYRYLGRKFFIGSLLGTLFSALFLELFTLLPVPETEPLLGALYGGLFSGVGLGLVFLAGASTGGTDIIVRFLKRKFPDLRLGKLMLALDVAIALLTGFVFHDINKTLYSIITLYVCSVSLDGVLYGLDYSTVAMIISDHFEQIAQSIDRQLDRGVTYLDGKGFYSQQDKTVLLCAVRKRQVGQLKELVSAIDPNAFMILQEAHQVLGEGFKGYSDNL